MKYCIQCGLLNASDEPGRHRCYDCFKAWKASGGVRKILGPVIISRSGIKTQKTTYEGGPLYCRECGRKHDTESDRYRYAMRNGGLITNCDKCAWEKKFGEPDET